MVIVRHQIPNERDGSDFQNMFLIFDEGLLSELVLS